MRRSLTVISSFVIAPLLLGPAAVAAPTAPARADVARDVGGASPVAAQTDADGRARWVAAWATAPQGVYPVGYAVGQPGATDAKGLTRIPALPGDQARDQTLRMIVRPTLDGDEWRLRLSNAFGTRPVTFDAVSLADQHSGSSIDPRTRTQVTFGGRRSVTVAPGEVVASDPVSFRVRGRGDDHVAVSLSVKGASGPMTWHATSFATSYVSEPGSGDRTREASGASFGASTTSWFYVAGLDVRSRHAGTVVALGDSITDGFFSSVNGDDRWPDQLERRLRARGGPTLSVVNQGIGGNMVTDVGRPPGECTPCDGPPLFDRLDRDVISQPGVRAVILLEGINDLGGGNATAESVIAGMKRTVNTLHAHGLPVVGATITPSGGAEGGYGTAATDAKRRAVNDFIRHSGTFDDVADFAKAVEDPRDPSRLKPEFATNSSTGGPGDKLHPGRAGFIEMANAVDLDELTHLVRKARTR
ncbi:GDSL-type esterase/lipase family protein [Agilicoccus flavus]|uniref:GDSL-type esterase/lipase family protein n=1 Tax=Agilicoccus flavus TaxID=2775968 RepID=UPI001CF62E68|nr:GDSL-type esterase/lipase family protein [Agilicoccus flavus]